MQRSDFSFHLPPELIAQHPLPNREDSRLLCLERRGGGCRDEVFARLPELLRPGDLLVFNDSRVIPARLYGVKASGGRVEILVERVLDQQRLLAQVRASKSPKPGTVINLEGGGSLIVDDRDGGFYILRHEGKGAVTDLLETRGHMPLPPYIRRADEAADRERYQTVYARHPGAVAAPTAGLHFSREILGRLERAGVGAGYVTLHVGAGTFQPVRAERVEDHVMHREWFRIDESLCDQIARTRGGGGRVIAVGTTVVRCLESASREGGLAPAAGETDIFIYPGYNFRQIDGLLTNFHLPESTLLMLVSAFAGRDNVLAAYRHAVEEKYRFFSYGDAMMILE